MKPDKAEAAAHDPMTTIWKTITIGNGKNKYQLVRMFKDIGPKLNDWAVGMMGQDAFTVTQEEEQVDLVVVSVADLGFNECTRYDVICQHAEKLGLKLCHAEDGAWLRTQYPNQPLHEFLVVAMKPICRPGGSLGIFLVVCDVDGLWLNGDHGDPYVMWSPDRRFVFRASK